MSVKDVGDGRTTCGGIARCAACTSWASNSAEAMSAAPLSCFRCSLEGRTAACARWAARVRTAQARESIIMVKCKDAYGNLVDADKRTRLWLELREPKGNAGGNGHGVMVAAGGGGGKANLAHLGTEAWGAGTDADERGMQSCDAAWADDGLYELRYVTTRAGTFDVVLWCEHEGEASELLHVPDCLVGTRSAPHTSARHSCMRPRSTAATSPPAAGSACRCSSRIPTATCTRPTPSQWR